MFDIDVYFLFALISFVTDIAASFPDIQIGFPKLPDAGRDSKFGIIQEWLKDCDGQHTCCPTTSGWLPKRVIDVSDEGNLDLVRLWKTRPYEGNDRRYVALSHRWGDESNPRFCTERHNVESFEIGISISSLPKTFRDAVAVTRALGIKYLWIDSLCIIQGPKGDWHEQAECMEDVFSSAYCVVAASCAAGTGDGFLKPRTPPNREYVTLSSRPEGSVYVCEVLDDFESHVIHGALNRRGWVLQERALARRTIHFAKEQVYWECGRGVRCQTLTKMRK